MEFYQIVKVPALDVKQLQNCLSISRLPDYCQSIHSVISAQNNQGEIYCLWGQFNIRYDIIKYGVRFSLLNCPHALAWSITYNAPLNELIIHCTIDKKDEDIDFIESIHQFINDWKIGLSKALL